MPSLAYIYGHQDRAGRRDELSDPPADGDMIAERHAKHIAV
jgi:hypothetical protein